jgi:methionyl aminopeptidase
MMCKEPCISQHAKLPGNAQSHFSHTRPNVPHYHKNKAKGIIKAGHVFTVEPMINLGAPADKLWLDNWTDVTTDGKRSAQFEHTLLVTETGYEILTARADEPVMTWNPDLINR